MLITPAGRKRRRRQVAAKWKGSPAKPVVSSLQSAVRELHNIMMALDLEGEDEAAHDVLRNMTVALAAPLDSTCHAEAISDDSMFLLKREHSAKK